MENSWLQPQLEQEKTLEKKQKETAFRLRLMVGLELKILGKIQTFGREHLQEIPKDKKVIIAATHISDIDMPVVIGSLGEDFELKVTTKSMNLDMSKDTFGSLGPLIAGRDNFLPIDYGRNKEGRRMADFNPDNFKAMAAALNDDKEVLIAAHNPTSGKLPRGGIGASYLYQLGHGDFIILPVAVNVKSEKPYRVGDEISLVKEHPDTDVFIGKPLELESIAGIDEYEKIIEKKNRGEELTADEVAESKRIRQLLLDNSDAIMESLAEMLPEEKRGYYEHRPIEQELEIQKESEPIAA